MKKTLILVGMLAVGYANAQYDGKVGINTETPKATLDLNVAKANKNDTTNEGILIPKLSKDRVAKISAPVEGTLVYVLDEDTPENPNCLISDYTGTNNKVKNITEKGFYYYDNEFWVRAIGTQQVGGIGLIVNGTNTTVSGTGTSTDPYKINATDTTYTAGNGITLTGTQFSVPINTTGTGNVITGVTQTTNGIEVTKGNITGGTTYTAGQAIDITSNKISVKSPVNTKTGAYTLATTDDNGYVYIDSATAVNVTVPNTLPAGFSCVLIQQGAGQVTIVEGSGVTLQTARGKKNRTKYSAIGIIKRTTSEATITGDATN